MKKYTIIFASLLLGAVSCNILDTKPESTMDKETFFATEDNLRMYSDAFYGVFNDIENYYESQSDHFVNKELSKEMLSTREVNSTDSKWKFTMLRRINSLIEYVDYCPDEAVRTKYVAIARFFRANFYFAKVKTYGDIPWVERILDNEDPALYEKTRDPRELVIHNILEDIDFAIENLPAEKSVYRVNKWSALALKAQICLYEGTFRKYHSGNICFDPAKPWSTEYESSEDLLRFAADAAEQIMGCRDYSLAPDYLTLFAEPDADSNEMILALKFEQTLSRKNNCNAFALMSTQGMPGLTKKFVDSFLMKDGTRFTDKEGWETMQFKEEVADRDPRLGCITRLPNYTRIGKTEVLAPDYGCSSTGFQLVKFVMSPLYADVDRVTMSFNDLPLFRLGEVYLIYAEAKAELDELTQDDLDKSVNQLRKRVGMPGLDLVAANASPDPYLLGSEYGYTNPVLLRSANRGVIAEIRRERSVELAQEGRRWDDLIRWREGKCIDQMICGPYFPGPGKYDLDGDGNFDIVLYEGSEEPKDKVQVYRIDGKSPELILSEGNKGYVYNHMKMTHTFDESKDYLYPVPTQERVLNNGIYQNPGWVDGLAY